MPDMAGAVAMVIALVLFPVVFLMSMSVIAAVFGTTLKQDGEARYEGSELLEIN
jgi:flagellar basal body-associated protein FliL